ncbi:MAG TPA: hypothetical protein VHG53_06265 [Candidatus Limnocylindria bacterium]|nr:hypothetical protein [Candidatus Limnocylindria bacterium]
MGMPGRLGILSDRAIAVAFVVLVSSAIVGLSAGETGATFTATTTNPSNSLNTLNVLPPAAQSVPTSSPAGTVNLSWSATPTSPGAHILTYLVFRNGTQVGSTSSLTFADTPPADGTYAYTSQAKIAQGAGFFTSANSTSQNGISDRIAPTMSITCNGAACGGWKNNSTVTISGVDGGTGMSSVTYSLDGGGNVTTAGSTKSITPADGTHTVAYFGTDVAGNVQSTVTQTVQIDTVAPTVATSVTATRGVGAGQIDLTWTAGTDARSGVAGYTVLYVQANACPAATPANYPSTVTVGAVASTTVGGLTSGRRYCFYLTTTDNAGNVSAASAIAGPTKAR